MPLSESAILIRGPAGFQQLERDASRQLVELPPKGAQPLCAAMPAAGLARDHQMPLPDLFASRRPDPVGAARGLAAAIMASAALWFAAAQVIRLLT